MADLTIDDELFHVNVEGDATRPALMLSHSLGVDLSMWEGQMPALTKLFRVVRYDARGHGGSLDSDAPASIAQLGRDALAILDALDIEKTHWVGLSMGGAVGLWLLANAPHRIERAVLANTAPRLGSPEGWNARITAVLANGMADTAAATIERWFSPGFAESEPERVAAIQTLLGQTSPQGYAACCAALRDMDLRESLRAIGHDVLVISGRDDPVVPHEDMDAFVDAIAGARHVALEARHMSSIEAEAAFTEAVVSFLTAKPARAKPAPRRRGAAAPLPAVKAAPRKAATRKPATAEVATSKRGSATGRSNAARNPLKKTPVKRTAAKKAKAAVRTVKKKPAAETRRRPVAKAVATRRNVPKVVAKKPPAKAPRKTATTRRPTPTTTARSAVKAAVKKIKPSKAAPKATKKAAVKAAPKKLPATRRKATTKARRPTGRRKP